MKCIVTGGAGFIGSHLCERLLSEGYSVIAIDNLAVGRERNLARCKEDSRFRFVKRDVAEGDMDDLFENADWVFHLGALADIVPSIVHPRDYHRTNVDGTVATLESARKAGVKRFIYAASSSCYGIPDTYPTPESAPIQPQYPYALSKYVGELYVLHWAKTYNLPALSLRLFNVYGPRARTSGSYGAVMGVFLGQKLAGRPYTVVGDGTQTRDFTFVDDVVDAMITAARSSSSGLAMNVGSGGTYSVNRLVQLLGGPVEHIPKRPGEPECTFADIALIRENLGWEPKITFEEGVKRIIEQIDDWRDAPVWTSDGIKDATRDWFRYLGSDNGQNP